MESTSELQQPSGTDSAAYVLSVSWEKGKVAAAYFKLATFELFVTHETLDFSPEFAMTANLMNRLKPDHVLAGGPIYFLKEILPFCRLPKDSDPNDYRVTSLRRTSLSQLLIYPQTEKNLVANRQRILALTLPGMPSRISPANRNFFIESVLPLHQNLVVHSLGVLLEFVTINRQLLFLGNAAEPIVSDLKVFFLESQVSLDDYTIKSLQIVSEDVRHPSAYKRSDDSSLKDVMSVYRLMDHCCSAIGSRTMKMLLSQPVRDSTELGARFETVSWCMMPQNSQRLQLIEKYLRNIDDIGAVFRNIVLAPHRIKNWNRFKRIVYNAYMVLKTCQEIGPDLAPNTLIATIAASVNDESYVRNVLHTIHRTVDLDEGLSQTKFSVKMGLDADLDDKKQLMMNILDSLQEAVQKDIDNLPQLTHQPACYYIPEIGYVIKCPQDEQSSSQIDQSTNNFTLIARSDDGNFFRNAMCDEFNEKYNHIYSDIREHESRICQRLILFLTERLAVIQHVVKLCAELDCILSFALVARKMSLVKPQLTDTKGIQLEKGRHILCELRHSIVPNDSNFSSSNQELITILSAPNSSGKSIYLKQVALIAFLAHVGSFVPASRAQMGLLDAIYSRINCPESAYASNSSFLNDVQQLGKVMTNSTGRSLILIDEFGKGTNFLEGQALLAACIEDLSKRGPNCPITLVSTHFADVYDIVKYKDGVAMKTFETIRSTNGEIVSTFRLKSGRSQRKYALQIGTAKRLLENMSNSKRETNAQLLFDAKIQFVLVLVVLRLQKRVIDFSEVLRALENLRVK